MLKDGSKIVDTKSAMVLEDLIGQFIYGDKNPMMPPQNQTKLIKNKLA